LCYREQMLFVILLVTAPELVVQQGHSGNIISLAVSPDGFLLASGANDNAVRL